MNKIDDYQQTYQLLNELRTLLQHHQLWQSESAHPHWLTSTAPFGCDVMSFENWLQFVFLPKMYQLVEQRNPLPTEIGLLPMGEYSWAGHRNIESLLTILGNIDQLLGKQ
ncbi:YqcC family protein [Neptunicella sp. SCSIO 80796]|uniref:YqcC family protein n=1 Tax=Neptunicella plasticusilytica TaxID=3117012 RepID=UPI003A4D7275